MQEELDLYGNERNLLNTYFNMGIILGTIPAQMIQLKYVRPSIWIPACELGWSALTMVMASAKSVETVCFCPSQQHESRMSLIQNLSLAIRSTILHRTSRVLFFSRFC